MVENVMMKQHEDKSLSEKQPLNDLAKKGDR